MGDSHGEFDAPTSMQTPDDDPTPRRDSDIDESDDSNHNRRHSGINRRRRATSPSGRRTVRSVQVSMLTCPLGGTAGGHAADMAVGHGTSVILAVPSTPRASNAASEVGCQGMVSAAESLKTGARPHASPDNSGRVPLNRTMARSGHDLLTPAKSAPVSPTRGISILSPTLTPQREVPP